MFFGYTSPESISSIDLPGDPSKCVLLSGTGVPGDCQKVCDFGEKKDELLLY